MTPGFDGLGRLLIGLGLGLVILGLVLLFIGRLPTGEGVPWVPFHLPGDIYVRRGNFTFFFPITTGIVISILLTVIFRLLGRR